MQHGSGEPQLLSIRWHGRGGFGAKTAAMLLAEAVIDAGWFAQASPEFGPERRGAPVQAFTRIGPEPIQERGPIERPDVLVVLDARLLETGAVLAGVGPETAILVNGTGARAIHGVTQERIVTLDASRIAREHIGRDLPNIPMLAAVVALFTPLEPAAFLPWLERRLSTEFRPEIVLANLAAAKAVLTEGLRASRFVAA
jgi:pyruvate ferredoxin oxidoreductase gamma subunit